MTTKQRQELRKEAHNLKAKIQIGSKGLTDQVFENIAQYFNTNELIKVKVNRDDDTNKDLVNYYAQTIASKTKSEIVYIIGTTIILFKPKTKESKQNGNRNNQRNKKRPRTKSRR